MANAEMQDMMIKVWFTAVRQPRIRSQHVIHTITYSIQLTFNVNHDNYTDNDPVGYELRLPHDLTIVYLTGLKCYFGKPREVRREAMAIINTTIPSFTKTQQIK